MLLNKNKIARKPAQLVREFNNGMKVPVRTGLAREPQLKLHSERPVPSSGILYKHIHDNGVIDAQEFSNFCVLH